MIGKINCPKDLKKLSIKECECLADEIREVLIKKASKYGGHVGSNLGMVEASIALHYVFDSPTDKFVFDVSHQSYTHKILTGRKEAFIAEEHYADVSGFTNPNESEHDLFQIGHTSTSVGLACGLAKARDLKGTKENVIAIIGDGALSGGEALESLDFAGNELKSNLIVVVNDNGMSIAENHGGLYKNLEQLRNCEGEAEHNLFKAFGLDYVFIKDGNDFAQVQEVFSKVKDIDHPIVVHMVTTKGKGYKYAEEDKESWHWHRPFDVKTGELLNPFSGESYDKIVNEYLLKKMKKDNSVVVLAAGVPLTAAFNKEKRAEAGEQFVDVGIAEEHAIAMAAGIARNGGKPVFTTDCTFYQRVYDQVAQELCINKCAATLLVRNASVYAQNDVTHLGFFDIALFSNLPNLVYLAPTNAEEYIAMLDWSIEQNEHPVAIRIPRFVTHVGNEEVIDKDYSRLNINKVLQNGEKIAIFAVGGFRTLGEEVADEIYKEWNVHPTLINPRYLTGLDEELLKQLKESHETVITLEDGIVDGGYGEKISRYYGRDNSIRVLNYGLKKEYLDRYNLQQVLTENHLKSDLILKDLRELRCDM